MSRFATLTAAVLFGTLSSAVPAAGTDGLNVVHCHDVARDLVQVIRQRNCTGVVLTPAQAAQVEARIEAEREARRQRVLRRESHKEQTGLTLRGAGTAFAINRRGTLLTSDHVVRECAVLEARNDDDSRAYRARLVARHEASDLALLRIDRPTQNILAFSPRPTSDGAPLALIGYPSEGMIRRIPRLTPVLVSHGVSNPARRGLIGIAGDVRRGNSGGPALDSKGRAVGVLKAKVNSVAARQTTGRTLTHLGVIVDTAQVLRFLTASRTPHVIANDTVPEKSGRALFELGRRAVFRIDCLVKK